MVETTMVTPVAVNLTPRDIKEGALTTGKKVGESAGGLQDVFAMQDLIQALGNPEDMPLEHFFAPHIYLRQITMRAGLLVVGKMHKTRHLNIITHGDVSVMTKSGPIRMTVKDKPIVFVSDPGVKKVLYTHEDTVWMTPHVTDSTDLKELEKELIVPEEDIRDVEGNLLLDEDTIKKLVGE